MIHQERGWIVSYDVASERDRRRLRRVLDGVGHRVLYSTYALDELSSTQMQLVMSELAEFVQSADSLLAAHHCEVCQVRELGQPSDVVDRCRVA